MEQLLAELRALRADVSHLVGLELPKALTYEHAARELSVSVPQLRKLIKKGAIATIVIGRRPKVPASEVIRLCRVQVTAELKRETSKQYATHKNGLSEAEKIRARLRRAH